jgi:hypothetical protein
MASSLAANVAFPFHLDFRSGVTTLTPLYPSGGRCWPSMNWRSFEMQSWFMLVWCS